MNEQSSGPETHGSGGAAPVSVAPANAAPERVAPVGTERVRAMSPARVRRGSRARWAIASLVTVVVLVTSAAGFMILSAGAATSALVGYVPAGSVGYLEIRLDAPGDQRQNAANLLSHFPGFADQSTLGTKLNEALDQFVGDQSGGKQTFTRDIRPWLGDSLAVAMTRIPPRTSATGARDKAGLLLVSVKDPAAARAWAESTLGPGSGSDTYAGVPLTTIAVRGETVEFGVVSNVLLMGDATSVHDAIDSKGAAAFADSASFKAAAAAVPGDRIAFGFLDLRRVTDAIAAAAPATASGSASPISLDQLPGWLAVSVRAESNSLSATVVLPQTNLAPVTSNHGSVLATKLPPNTVAAGEIHDLAALIASVTTTLRNTPGTQSDQNQIDQALKALGGLDALVGWMGDATVAAVGTAGSADVAAGLVIQAKDSDTAAEKLLQLKNLASLLGGTAGLTISDETYSGTTITVIDAGDVARVTGGAPIPGVATGDHFQIAIAQKGDLVIAGIGDAFVKAVLDTKSGAALSDQDAYRNALDRAGASNTGQMYVDLRALLDIATRQLPAADYQRYESDIKPYLDPFRAFAASGSAGDPNRARFVITVK